MADSTPRKRSRVACQSCQSRKRKCTGEQPCATCLQVGEECIYNTAPRKRRIRASNVYQTSLPVPEETQKHSDAWSQAVPKPVSVAGSAASPMSFKRPEDSRGVSHSLEANSGAAFVRKLGLRIDPARAPRLHLFAWNVGERRESNAIHAPPTIASPATITKLLCQEEMRRLTAIYFEKVDPCYPFLNRQDIFSHILQRWQTQPDLPEQPYDAVLYGVAAFGYLFSSREITPNELQVVDVSHSILQKSIMGTETPSIDIITGWVLRAAYLRMTASPHAAWMASCSLMHLIEAAGLHLEPSDTNPAGILQPSQQQNSSSSPQSTEKDTRRRLFGMARHLNTWISFDLGRSRVVLHGAETQSLPIPATKGNPNSRASIFHLLPLTESLDPTTSAPQSLQDLESALTCVLDLIYSEPSLILVQTNLALCIYRRVRALNAHALLPSHLDRALSLASRGLGAARNMIAANSPWHQVANVPFQVICTLLAIDSQAALALLPDAMATLREVVGAYDTAAMREAYSTAYLLVAMHQRRKEDDTKALADVLRANAVAVGQQEEKRREDDGGEMSGELGRGLDQDLAGDVGFSWLEDLVIDMPSLQNFDIDQFLMTDVPWPLPEMGI